MAPAARFYFVHSYHVACDREEDVAGWTSYGYDFASVVERGNVMGTQFHPEKSHRFGMALLRNFAALT
jgi:glutamine amidotransferase